MSHFKSIDIQFENNENLTLAARLDLPENPSHFAIFSPCFTCTKETLATHRISRQLAKCNIAVLRIDFTGLGESDGAFEDSNFSTMISDIISANKYLSEHYKPASILLGHSMGGTASYAAASQLDDIKAIASIASPSTPSHVLHHFGEALTHIKAGNNSTFYVAGKQYTVKPQFLADLKKHNLEKVIRDLNKTILIFHGEKDQLVDIKDADQLFSIAPHPKNLISLETADHILSDRNDANYIADVIYNWVQRYLN